LGDQKTRDDKKHVNADKTPLEASHLHVEENNSDNCDCSKALDIRSELPADHAMERRTDISATLI
jgi:hypothetical protein